MKSSLLACLSLALLGAACTVDDPAKETTGGGGNLGGGGGSVPTGGAGGTIIVGETSIEGTVLGADSSAFDQARVAVCLDSDCTQSTTDATGAFSFANVAATTQRFEARGPESDSPPSIAAITVAVDLEADVPFTFPGALVLPTTGLGRMLIGSSETISVTDELELTVAGNDLTLPAGVTSAYLAGVLVEDQHRPPHVLPATTVAVWTFNPYGAVSSSEVKVAINNVFSLPANQLVELHTVDHETGLLVKVAEGRVSGSGLNITINGGIRRFTWLVLALVT